MPIQRRLPHTPNRQRAAGFTLIELMIAVAVIAILAAVAIPQYSDYVRKSRRSDAWTMLQVAQQAQERFRLTNTTYSSSPAALPGACSGSPCGSQYYALSGSQIAGKEASQYKLIATARSGSSQAADTGCTSITLEVEGASVKTEPASCWKK